MSKLSLSVAVRDYDRTRPLTDGSVQIDGVDPVFMALEPEESFFRAFRHAEFDICELSMSSSIVKTAQNDFAYVAVPAFVSRAFRHTSIYVRTDRVRGPADLRGRKVGVSTVGSVTSWIISEVSRQKGWGYDGMAQVPIGDDANRIAALKTRSIDGAIVNLAQALNFVQRGEGKVLLRFGELVKDFHIHVIFATDKAIAGKPEALRGFLKGWFQTISFMRTHRNETVEIAKEVMGTDVQTTNGIYDELMPMFSDTGRFDPKALAVLRKSFVEMKTLPEEPDMGKLYTEAFLPATGGSNR